MMPKAYHWLEMGKGWDLTKIKRIQFEKTVKIWASHGFAELWTLVAFSAYAKHFRMEYSWKTNIFSALS